MQASHRTKVLYTRQSLIGINPGDLEPALGRKTQLPFRESKIRTSSDHILGERFCCLVQARTYERGCLLGSSTRRYCFHFMPETRVDGLFRASRGLGYRGRSEGSSDDPSVGWHAEWIRERRCQG